jgi:uncharacterized protein (DUF2062 family)
VRLEGKGKNMTPFIWSDVRSWNRIKTLATYIYDRFIRIHGRPKDIAWGMAIGLFIGMTPTVGIQTYIAIFIASIMKKNKISAAAGVWITNPLSIPFFYGTTYYLGAKILGYPEKQSLILNGSFETLRAIGKHMFISLWFGGILAGLIVAIVGYFFTLLIIYSTRRKANRLLRKK